MNKNLINRMLQSNSEQELKSIINERVSREKAEYRQAEYDAFCKRIKKEGKASEDFLQKHNPSNFSFSKIIYPPRSERDLEIYSYQDFLDPDYVGISICNSWPIYMYYFDEKNEIYEMFAHELSKLKNTTDPSEVISAVSETVFAYIGGVKVQGDDFTRLRLLKDGGELGDDGKNYISVFKGTQNAWCVERSCFAHQLFKFLGIDSKIIMATISNNGEHQIHAFNLLKIDNKTFLFDASVMNPPKQGEKNNAVAYVLPADVYDSDMQNVEPLPTREITGLSGKKYSIIYDLKNRKIFENANLKPLE